ncbi:macro domain-containing protein [Psychrobacter sp. AOP5-CZ1-12]|uniref:macro domain-containing protein n=1 Tax=Psychrobacter sp. AOP5-CZ1-12 TaxID=3457651 RepID=UPI00402B32D8
MSLVIIKGNIWTTNHKVLVNTVNCEGVMGAGIALESGLRYPEMYARYKRICEDGKLNIGNLWIYKDSNPYWIMNFPTKKSWKLPSKIEYLELGLKKFVETYKEKEVESVAFPLLGAANGGLDEKIVLEVMKNYLGNLDIPVEIYLYDTKSVDDYFPEFKEVLLSNQMDDLVRKTKIQEKYLSKIIDVVKENDNVYQIMQLKKIKDIGNSTIKKIFDFQRENMPSKNISSNEQQSFDF